MVDKEEEKQFVIRPLQLNDLPFLVALEDASFPPNETTLEKVIGDIQKQLLNVPVDRIPCAHMSGVYARYI